MNRALRKPFTLGYINHRIRINDMNRRYALMTLSGVMATPLLVSLPRLALAQSEKLPTLNLSQYKAETLMLGSLSRQASQLAEERTRNPKIKEFAEFEIAEQTTMGQVLTNENTLSRSRWIPSMRRS